MISIRYTTGFRHQLAADAYVKTEIYPPSNILTEYIELFTNGDLIVKYGFAWDGPSGPCRWVADRLPEFLRRPYLRKMLPGSMFHDALYELIRLGLLDRKWREQIDKEFRKINLENKMFKPRAWWTYKAVRCGGVLVIDPKHRRTILTAP